MRSPPRFIEGNQSPLGNGLSSGPKGFAVTTNHQDMVRAQFEKGKETIRLCQSICLYSSFCISVYFLVSLCFSKLRLGLDNFYWQFLLVADGSISVIICLGLPDEAGQCDISTPGWFCIYVGGIVRGNHCNDQCAWRNLIGIYRKEVLQFSGCKVGNVETNLVWQLSRRTWFDSWVAQKCGCQVFGHFTILFAQQSWRNTLFSIVLLCFVRKWNTTTGIQ